MSLMLAGHRHMAIVRAQVSRLRRAVGVLVATNPYRLADGVVLEVADG